MTVRVVSTFGLLWHIFHLKLFEIKWKMVINSQTLLTWAGGADVPSAESRWALEPLRWHGGAEVNVLSSVPRLKNKIFFKNGGLLLPATLGPPRCRDHMMYIGVLSTVPPELCFPAVQTRHWTREKDTVSLPGQPFHQIWGTRSKPWSPRTPRLHRARVPGPQNP